MRIILIVSVVIISLFGCEKKAVDAGNRPVPIVIVDGKSYTNEDLARDINIRYLLTSRKLSGLKFDMSRMLTSISNSVALGVVPRLLMDKFFSEKQIEVSPEENEKVREKFLKAFGGKAFETPPFNEYLESEIRFEALYNAYCMKFHRNDYEVTDELVDQKLKEIEQWNLDVPVTNAYFWATASNIVKSVRNGRDFASLADAVSQEHRKLKGGFYGKCNEAEFSDEAGLWTNLCLLATGEVTDPVMTHEGIVIFKCDKPLYHDEDTGCDTVDISRIVFYPAVKYQEYTEDKLRKELVANCRRDVTEKILKELISKAEISFPCGLTIFPKSVRATLQKLYIKTNSNDKEAVAK